MEKIWVDLKEFPNYKLSNFGEIQLKDKEIRGLGYRRKLNKNKPLKINKNNLVYLRKNGLSTSASITKLMMKYFPEVGIDLSKD
jgi:hypothetical protein